MRRPRGPSLLVTLALICSIVALLAVLAAHYSYRRGGFGDAVSGLVCLWLICDASAVVLIITGCLWLVLLRRDASGRRRESLTIMCSILSIVLSIPFSPFAFESSVRSPVSRAKTDMRSLAAALEAYCVDNNAYPPQLVRLTSPVAYLSVLPLDRLSPNGDATFRYYHDKNGWIVWSSGPDHRYDLSATNISSLYVSEGIRSGHDLAERSYDVTNGTDSSGDIWRARE